MRRHQLAVLFGAALLAMPAAVAVAADIPEIPPPPLSFGHEWYLRGDIGFSNQHVGSLYNVLYEDVDTVDTVQKDFSAAPFIALGIGFKHSDHLRFDVTGEYRGGADFTGLDIVTSGPDTYDDNYTAIKKELTFLVNGYLDFNDWHGIKPFIGAGVGMSYNTISDFRDVSVINDSLATGASASKLNFAWALYAGAGYQVNDRLTIEAAYRYIDLGNAASGDLITYEGTNDVYNPMEFRHLTSHDFKVGFRWAIGDSGTSYYPPVVKY